MYIDGTPFICLQPLNFTSYQLDELNKLLYNTDPVEFERTNNCCCLIVFQANFNVQFDESEIKMTISGQSVEFDKNSKIHV